MMEFQPRGQTREPSSRLTGANGEANFSVEGDVIRIQFLERLQTGETVNRMTLALSAESGRSFARLLAREIVLADTQRMRLEIAEGRGSTYKRI